MSEFRNKIINPDDHKNGNNYENKKKIFPVFFLQKQSRNQIKIVQIKQDNSCCPLYVKIVVDSKWTFIKLNQGSQNKENPNDAMEQNFI